MKGDKVKNGHLKFYIDQWEPIEPGLLDEKELLIKGGWTVYTNVEDRFDEELNPDYNIKALKKHFKLKKVSFSISREAKVVKQMEKDFLHKHFPPLTHKVWMENKFKIEDNRALDNTGVTEFRILSTKEHYDLCQSLYNGTPGPMAEYKITDEEKLQKHHARKKYGKHNNT